jgi:hypothetical protein
VCTVDQLAGAATVGDAAGVGAVVVVEGQVGVEFALQPAVAQVVGADI